MEDFYRLERVFLNLQVEFSEAWRQEMTGVQTKLHWDPCVRDAKIREDPRKHFSHLCKHTHRTYWVAFQTVCSRCYSENPWAGVVTGQHVHMLMAIHVIGQVTSELAKMLHLGPKLHLHLSIRQNKSSMKSKILCNVWMQEVYQNLFKKKIFKKVA